MEKIKVIFDALPHVNEIWVTKDGNFHLHNHYGGKRYAREDVEKNSKPLSTEATKK